MIGAVLRPPLPVVHDQLLCFADLKGEVVVLAPHYQVSDLLPIGCLIIVSDQAYYRCVVGKLDDGVGVVSGHTVVGNKGVQEGTNYTPLRGSSVEDQHGRCVVTYPYHLGAAVRKSRIQLQMEVFSPRVLSLVMSFEGTMELNAVVNEQHSHIGVPFVQVRKGSVECNRDCVICGSVGAVCELEWVQCM